MPGCPVPDALVVSGAGPYLDPWHDFAATSSRLAALLRDSGLTVDVTTEVEEALADPRAARLLVVNIGNPTTPRPPVCPHRRPGTHHTARRRHHRADHRGIPGRLAGR